VRFALVRLAIAWAAASIVAFDADARADGCDDVEKAHSAYVAHKYAEAAERLTPLANAKLGLVTDPDCLADARMYLAAVWIAQGERDKADAMFEQLLSDRPEYTPDPLRVSLDASDAFIDARTKLRDQLSKAARDRVVAEQLQKAKAEAESQRAALRLAMLEKLAGEEVIIERHSRWIALLPFGAGQFQNGQRALGVAFLVGESLFVVGGAVGALLTSYNVSQLNQAGQSSAANEYSTRAREAALYGNLSTLMAGALALAGVVHAEIAFVPQRVEIHRRAIPTLSLAPCLSPAFVGLAGTF
jgi:tetratricopeptide (TPR) repeat protein